MYTATCRNYRCTQTTRGMLRFVKNICALLDSLNVLSILSTRFWVSFVSIKVIHTMHTSIYFVILILYFCELWPFGTYNPNIRPFRCRTAKVHFFTRRPVTRMPRVTTLPPNVTCRRVTHPSADRTRRCLTSERSRASQPHR